MTVPKFFTWAIKDVYQIALFLIFVCLYGRESRYAQKLLIFRKDRYAFRIFLCKVTLACHFHATFCLWSFVICKVTTLILAMSAAVHIAPDVIFVRKVDLRRFDCVTYSYYPWHITWSLKSESFQSVVSVHLNAHTMKVLILLYILTQDRLLFLLFLKLWVCFEYWLPSFSVHILYYNK